MGWNNLRDIQYSNMFKMVNSFLYEYRCDMEMRIYESEKIVYERDSENRRKRKIVKDEKTRTECLIVHGNGEEYICSVVKNDDGKFDIYRDGYVWCKDSKPYFTAENSEQAKEEIEKICREHYIQKYGSEHEPYSYSKPKAKRLSVGEICDWYNQFRKLGMSIADVERIAEENRQIKKENDEYKKLLIGVAKKKGLI